VRTVAALVATAHGFKRYGKVGTLAVRVKANGLGVTYYLESVYVDECAPNKVCMEGLRTAGMAPSIGATAGSLTVRAWRGGMRVKHHLWLAEGSALYLKGDSAPVGERGVRMDDGAAERRARVSDGEEADIRWGVKTGEFFPWNEPARLESGELWPRWGGRPLTRQTEVQFSESTYVLWKTLTLSGGETHSGRCEKEEHLRKEMLKPLLERNQCERYLRTEIYMDVLVERRVFLPFEISSEMTGLTGVEDGLSRRQDETVLSAAGLPREMEPAANVPDPPMKVVTGVTARDFARAAVHRVLTTTEIDNRALYIPQRVLENSYVADNGSQMSLTNCWEHLHNPRNCQEEFHGATSSNTATATHVGELRLPLDVHSDVTTGRGCLVIPNCYFCESCPTKLIAWKDLLLAGYAPRLSRHAKHSGFVFTDGSGRVTFRPFNELGGLYLLTMTTGSKTHHVVRDVGLEEAFVQGRAAACDKQISEVLTAAIQGS